MLPYRFYDGLSKSRLVCSTLCRVLSIDKRVVFFAVLGFAMCNGHFDIISTQVNDGIQHVIGIIVVFQQIFKPIFRFILFAIKNNCQSRVEINIVFEHTHNVLVAITIVLKDAFIRHKRNGGSFAFAARFLCGVFDEFASLKHGNFGLVIPYRLHLKMG